MFDFMCAGSVLFFGCPCTLGDLDYAMTSPRLDMTSPWPVRLHIDRGLKRHGYQWVPTDQGPKAPCQVDPTYQKPRQPVSGPGDLIHNLGDIERLQETLSRSQRIRGACGARLSPRSRLDTTNRSADHGIHPVITEDDLPNL
jgi:hypothetical protein